jgi:hypothetical protein
MSDEIKSEHTKSYTELDTGWNRGPNINIAESNGYAMRQSHLNLQIPCAGEPPGGRFRLPQLTEPPT